MQKVLKIVYITIIVSCHNFILADLLDSELEEEIALELVKSVNVPFIFISSISNLGLSKLKDKIWTMLN